MKHKVAVLVACALIGTLPSAYALSVRPVPLIQDGRLTIDGGDKRAEVPVHASLDWSEPATAIRRAVVIIRGWDRDDLQAGERAEKAAGAGASDAIIITPQFLVQQDIDDHRLPDAILRWRPDDWQRGYNAQSPTPVSSFDVIDAIFRRLGDRQIFPNLQTVVLAEHSAGGQLVQRYALVGHGLKPLEERGISVRFVVANPSSYAYLSGERPGHQASALQTDCSGFNEWGYGLTGDMPSYATRPIDKASLARAYLSRDITYLLGTSDNDPDHPALDRSCSAEAEGATRFERGKNFYEYVRSRASGNLSQRVFEVPGIGHHSSQMFSSECGVKALFDVGICSPVAP